jgi:hypothetical protein
MALTTYPGSSAGGVRWARRAGGLFGLRLAFGFGHGEADERLRELLDVWWIAADTPDG